MKSTKVLSILFISLLFAISLSAQSDAPTEYPVEVYTAELITLEDGGDALHVRGALGSSCVHTPVEVRESEQRETLVLALFQTLPDAFLCPENLLVPYEDTIPLTLANDTRSILVNEFRVEIPEASAIPPLHNGGGIDPSGVFNTVFHIIDEVNLVLIEDPQAPIWALHIVATQPLGCEFPVIVGQTFDDTQNWVHYDIYRNIPGNVRCVSGNLPYEATIALPLKFGTAPNSVIEINDFIVFTTLALTDNEVLPNPLVFTPEALESFLLPGEREYALIDTVNVVDITPTQVTLEIIGNHRNGCNLPVRTTQGKIGDEITIEVYRAAPESIEACPAVIRMYAEEITIEGEFIPGQRYVFTVNEFTGEFRLPEENTANLPSDDSASAESETIRVPHIIESIDVEILESFPPQVILNLTGAFTDGCEAETQHEVTQEGNKIFVEVYRELPIDVMCPQVITPYTGSINIGAFAPTTYSIDVNGLVIETTLD